MVKFEHLCHLVSPHCSTEIPVGGGGGDQHCHGEREEDECEDLEDITREEDQTYLETSENWSDSSAWERRER